MFCIHCGSFLQSSAATCSVCGKANTTGIMVAISPGAVPAGVAAAQMATLPPVIAQERADSEVERLRADHPELVGVRGWLAWFCIVAAIVSPVIVLVSTLAEPSPYSLFDLALTVYSVLTGVAIWKLWPRALKLTKVLLIIQFAIGVILVAGQILDSSTANSSSATPDVSGARVLVFSIVWFSYFKKSRRVRATFGRNI